jgi:hypothetical protein
MRWHHKLSAPLYWNIFIRLTLEATLEISVSVINNIQMKFQMNKQGYTTVDQKHLPFFWINLFTNVASMVYLIFGIPLVIFFYLRNKDLWETKQFEGKFGAIFDSLRTDKKFSLFYPVFFMFRRIIFAWQCICFAKNYLPTMHTQFTFSLI